MSAQLDRIIAAARPATSTTAYGHEPDQVYDIREPDRPRGVTIVLLHGGFWRPTYDRQHASAQATALAHNGFHVAVVEYRRASRAGWPTMRDDLLDATRAVRDDSRLPTPWMTMGHSAGGHLALWLQHQPVATDLLGTVALAACADLRVTYDLDLGHGAARALMGATPEHEAEEWRAADPARLGVPRAPVRLVHGDADDSVPLTVARSYRDAVDSPLVTVDVLTGAGHFDLIDPSSDHFTRVLAAAEWLADRA